MAAVLGGTAQKHVLGFSPLCFAEEPFHKDILASIKKNQRCAFCVGGPKFLFYIVPGKSHPKMDSHK